MKYSISRKLNPCRRRCLVVIAIEPTFLFNDDRLLHPLSSSTVIPYLHLIVNPCQFTNDFQLHIPCLHHNWSSLSHDQFVSKFSFVNRLLPVTKIANFQGLGGKQSLSLLHRLQPILQFNLVYMSLIQWSIFVVYNTAI